MKHFRVVFQPDEKEVSIHQGATLLEAASQAGIVLTTSCGGKGTCGKCRVQLAPSGQDVHACQHLIQQDLAVTVPAVSRFYRHKILEHGIAKAGTVQASIAEKYRRGGCTGHILGLAIDVGTTTVVLKLLDLAQGACLATEAMLNPQTRYGDDVISRIHYGRSETGLAEMQRTIIDAINGLTGRLCRRVGVEADSIYEACVVGNTTMNHILLRFPVTQLGQAPYRAHSVEAHDVPPVLLGLHMNPGGNVHLVENIAGFVGADTTAVALAVDMDRVTEATLAVDIGTNGELVLGVRERLYAASCAAGPALEGARIRQGSRAAEGAIEAVVIDDDGDIALDVIGGTPPQSICGSGLIDAVAVLLKLGFVDATGRLSSGQYAKDGSHEAVTARILEVDGQGAFCLAWDEHTKRPAVVLTQKDIREFQLAKGAIAAGIQLLLRKSGVLPHDLGRVLLAGAFGNYIRPSSAVAVGLLPDVPLDRIQFVGNAAASGAEMMLLSEECRQRSAELAARIEYTEVAHEPQFSEVFAEAMFLGPQTGS